MEFIIKANAFRLKYVKDDSFQIFASKDSLKKLQELLSYDLYSTYAQ